MTTLSRRKKTAPEPAGPRPPKRMQDVQSDLGEPPWAYGVDQVAAQEALEKFLRRDKGSDKPFCTCGDGGPWSFDGQIGVYIHPDPKCWKPSKAIYEAALRAGVLGELPLR